MVLWRVAAGIVLGLADHGLATAMIRSGLPGVARARYPVGDALWVAGFGLLPAGAPLRGPGLAHWRNFTDPLADWLPVDTSSIGAALMAEVQEPGRLAECLSAVEKQLNVAVGRVPPGV